MPATVDRILEAALDVFVTHGYIAGSMAQIRERAGVSNGSLFHFFPRKADLAAGVLSCGMREFQAALLAALPGATAADGVRNAVRASLAWITQHPDLARFLFTDVPDEVLLAAEPQFGAENRRYVEIVTAWLAEKDLLRGRRFDLVHALWLGPTMEFSRHWLRGRGRTEPEAAAAELASAAWSALRSR
jgi:AcrR family transcriptional regulator